MRSGQPAPQIRHDRRFGEGEVTAAQEDGAARAAADLQRPRSALLICTRKVSIGMLFAQARQVMRGFEAARLPDAMKGNAQRPLRASTPARSRSRSSDAAARRR